MTLNVTSGSEFLVNDDASGTQRVSTSATLTNGNFVTIFESQGGDADDYGVRAVILDSDGNEVVAEFLVNSSQTTYQRDAAVTALADGGFAVTWYTYDSTADGDGYAVMSRIFDADGNETVGEFVVNSQTTGLQSSPNIAQLDNGNLIYAWFTTDTTQDGSASAVKARIFDTDGNEVVAEFLVNSTASGYQYDPEIAVRDDGRFIITYISQIGSFGSNYITAGRLFNNDGTEYIGESTTPLGDTSSASDADVATLSDNAFAILEYRDDAPNDYFLNIYESDGTERITGIQITDNDATAAVERGTIFVMADDRIVVTYVRNGTDNDVFATIFNPDGTVSVEEFQINQNTTDEQTSPFVVEDGAGILLFTWQTEDTSADTSGGAIKGRLFDAGHVWQGTDDAENWQGSSARDYFSGEKGADTFKGKGGSDQIEGGNGKDTLKGGGGADIIHGDNGKDKLKGQSGSDELKGGKGNDTLNGGGGADELNGGKGNDKLKGKGGADTFVFKKYAGNDTILDFKNGTDKIDLSAFGFSSKAKAKAKFYEVGTATDDKFAFDHKGTKITIKGMDLGNLDNSDLII